MTDSNSASLSAELDAYEASVAALGDAIESCGEALKAQDGEALPAAIDTQQRCANALQETQRRLTAFSEARGHGSLREAVIADPSAATLQPRYKEIKHALTQIQHALVAQAEALSRAMTNNAELIALLTNAQPSGDYEADGHTRTTAKNTLIARA